MLTSSLAARALARNSHLARATRRGTGQDCDNYLDEGRCYDDDFMAALATVPRVTKLTTRGGDTVQYSFTDHHMCQYTCGACNRTVHPCDNGVEDWKCNLFLVDQVADVALVYDRITSCSDQPGKNRKWLRSGQCSRTCVTNFAEFKLGTVKVKGEQAWETQPKCALAPPPPAQRGE